MYAAITIALYLLLIRPASNLGRDSGPGEIKSSEWDDA